MGFCCFLVFYTNGLALNNLVFLAHDLCTDFLIHHVHTSDAARRVQWLKVKEAMQNLSDSTGQGNTAESIRSKVVDHD